MNPSRGGRTHGAMPKRISYIFVALACGAAISACNSQNYSSLYGPTPTPVPTATTYVPIPTITGATVEVTVAGSPVPNQTVAESTPDPGGKPGAPIASVVTNTSGQAAFSGLTPGQIYCWSDQYSSNVLFSNCTKFWQTTTVFLGN